MSPKKKITKDKKTNPKATELPQKKDNLLLEARKRKETPSIFKIKTRKHTPIVFTLEDVKNIITKGYEKKPTTEVSSLKEKQAKALEKKKNLEAALLKKQKPQVLGAASLSDILGFNPNDKKSRPQAQIDESKIAKKDYKYYKLLMDLRKHVKEGLDLHTQDTLMRSSKEDSGDLSSYSQHMADAGTDTFDRDFALSLLSSEQDALYEIEEAIQRILSGAYGTCEITGNPIGDERLEAVPFTRYSLEGQKQLEAQKPTKRERGGIFAETSLEDSAKYTDEDQD